MRTSHRVVLLVTVLAVVLFLGGVALGRTFQVGQMMSQTQPAPPAMGPMMGQMMAQMMQDPQTMQAMMNACGQAMQDPQVQQRMQEMMQTPAMQQMMQQMLQMPR